MEIICAIMQALSGPVGFLLVVLLVIAIAGLVSSTCHSPKTISKKSAAQIRRIASEGRRQMDDLSDQYLDDLYDQVTRTTQANQQPRSRR